jgi:hypothetical protein
MPWRIRVRGSSQDFTRICRRKVRAILPKSVSTMFSQEPCLGVRTYWNRLGCLARNTRVSLEICAEWLSRINRMAKPNDALGWIVRVEVCQQRGKLHASVALLYTSGDMAILSWSGRAGLDRLDLPAMPPG